MNKHEREKEGGRGEGGGKGEERETQISKHTESTHFCRICGRCSAPDEHGSRCELTKVAERCRRTQEAMLTNLPPHPQLLTLTTLTAPWQGSYRRHRSRPTVLFPEPEGPTSATVSPGLITNEKFRSTGRRLS